MRSRTLVALEHFWNLLLGLLRRKRPNVLGVVRRAFSALLGLINLIRSPSRQLKESSLTRDDGDKWVGWRSQAPMATRKDTICYSTRPTHLLGGADGPAGSGSNSDPETLDRTETLVGPQGVELIASDAEESRTSSDVEMKQLILHNPNSSEVIGGEEVYMPPGIPPLSSVVGDLWPVDVYESERYRRNIKIVKGLPEGFTIPPLMIPCSKPKLPPAWVKYIHPEGAPYFWDSNRRVITDADILDLEVLSQIEDCISKIWEYIEKYDIAHPRGSRVHLYLEPLCHDPGFGYYFVDHASRTLFWLEKKFAYDMVKEIQTPLPNMEHVGIILLSQYWGHNEYFPHLLDIPEDALFELQDILRYAVGDRLSAESSLVPFTLEQVKDMQQQISEYVASYYSKPLCRATPQIAGCRGLGVGAQTFVYRMLSSFTRDRFLNFYGQRAARLFLTHSLFEKNKRTWFIHFFSPLLFYAPEVHLERLQSMSTDNIVSLSSWNKLLRTLEEEWKESVLYATVLLTSNVSFLDIGSLDELGSQGHRDPAQQASYFSVAVSIGAIALGLVLVRQHPRQYPQALDRKFLLERSHSAIRLEVLAVMYSLPYALLMYGILTFFLAFSIMCSKAKDAATIVISTFAWTTTILFLLWCISASFKFTCYKSLGRRCNALKSKLHQRWCCKTVARGTACEEESV